MVQFITATYENGVLTPTQPLNLQPHSRVRLMVEPLEESADLQARQQAWAAIEHLWQHSAINSEGRHLTRQQLHERH